MQDNIENTKEINLDDLVPDNNVRPVKKSTTSKKKKNSKNAKKQQKFKPIYLVPIIFIFIIAIVGFTVWKASNQKGPVYGDRCVGMAEISDSVLNETISEMKSEYSEISNLAISVNCKTVKIDLSMVDGTSDETATDISKNILLTIDAKVGLSKSNSNSNYSDLFGTLNGKTQYHVDFTIKGNTDAYPIFGSKHPQSDVINFTYNTARDPELVEKLYEQQAEDDEETSEE